MPFEYHDTRNAVSESGLNGMWDLSEALKRVWLQENQKRGLKLRHAVAYQYREPRSHVKRKRGVSADKIPSLSPL